MTLYLNVALRRAKTTLREAAWVGRVTQGRKAVDALDPRIVSQVHALNAYDADLYRFATEEIAAGRLG